MDPTGSVRDDREEVPMDGKDDRREGRFDEAKGNVKEALGDATDNDGAIGLGGKAFGAGLIPVLRDGGRRAAECGVPLAGSGRRLHI
jgi:hypothetical protein